MNTHKLRMQHLPKSVHVMMVGESPPAGGTFFYAGNSILFRHTVSAFEKAFEMSWSSNDAFLRFFMSKGFFLDDLCPEPVNHLPDDERHMICRANTKSLARRIAKYEPIALIVTPKSILDYVTDAMVLSGHEVQTIPLPFPSRYRWRSYIEELAAFLNEAVN